MAPKKLIISSILFLLIGFIFYYLSYSTVFFKLDVSINDFFTTRTPTGSPFGVIVKDVSSIGNSYIVIFLSIVGISTIYYKCNMYVQALIMLASSSNLLLGIILKSYFSKVRPISGNLFDASHSILSGSYPSLHALHYTVFWGLIIYFSFNGKLPLTLRKTLRWLGVYLIFLVGLSRVYLQYHWVTDVIGGYIFGFAFILFFIGVDKLLALRSKQ